MTPPVTRNITVNTTNDVDWLTIPLIKWSTSHVIVQPADFQNAEV